MPADDDIARLLPEPPPPRASRREVAIGAAMRRFDGVETPAAAARPAMARQRPAWTRVSRTQIGAFASIALVAVVGLPLALNTLRERLPAPSQPAPAAVVVEKAVPAPAARGPVVAPSPTLPAQPAPAASPLPAVALFPEPLSEPPAPPPAAPPQQASADTAKPCAGNGCEPEITVQGSRAPAPKAMESVNAVTVVSAEPYAGRVSDDTDGQDVIVTASRIARPTAAYRRGDWNACTVNDPSHSLGGCNTLVDPGAKGAAGQAAARVADGLALAWQGDMDGAISAFDAAIALQPRLAFAYLNRGLAYQRQGDSERALADLNRAVRYAPYAARGYYNRSLLYREKGDIDRARADEERAVGKDARYGAVVE